MRHISTTRKNRIGIFGGSFDPLHKGHILIALAALKNFLLDKIYFVPAFSPPHRTPKNLSDPSIRLEMLKKVLSGQKKFAIDFFELRSRRRIYTYQTIERYKKRFPSAEIYFIMGGDSLKELPRWKKGLGLLDMCRFIVAPREGVKISPKVFAKNRRDSIFFLNMPLVGISSSAIRSSLWNPRLKSSFESMVEPSVVRIIRKNFLYLDENIRQYLKENLDSAKYRHSLSVAEIAQKLAAKLAADKRKALIAGLIHDLGRCVPVDEYIDIAVKNGLVSSKDIKIYLRNPFLLHSFVSAFLAQKIFGLKDKEILAAALNHTIMTMKDRASIYDKIIYVADAISGDRRYPGVDKIRRVALRGDIDKAVYMVASMKLSYVIKKKKYLVPFGIDVYNSFLARFEPKAKN